MRDKSFFSQSNSHSVLIAYSKDNNIYRVIIYN